MLAVVAMLSRVVVWGIMGSFLAHIHTSPAATASILMLAAAAALLAVSWIKRLNLTVVVRAFRFRRLILLSVLEAGAYFCYILALRWAPVGPALALCQVSPVIIMMAGISTGRRSVSVSNIASCTLIVGAIVALACSHASSGAPHLQLGLLAGVASSSLVAVYSVVLKRVVSGPAVSVLPTAGVLGLVTGSILALATPFGPLQPMQLMALVPLGLVMAIPSACYMFALARLSVVTIGSIDLLQPFCGGLASYAMFGGRPSLGQILAVPLVMGAVYLDLRATQIKPTFQSP